MDNVKIFAAKLWKQRFWVLASTISLFGLIFLFLVTSHLKDNAKTRSNAINSAKNDIFRVTSIPDHPNEEFHKEQEEINKLLENAVGEAWEQKWEDQKGILDWPEILGPPFLGIVEPLRPIERNFPLTPDQDWEEPLRVHQRVAYADYISEELPDLAETVRATWNVATGTRNNEEELGMVHWDPANQQEIQDKYFQWPKRRNRQPTTLDVLYAQEDLWVLEALTKIIAETNRDSDARHNLIIKDIDFIQIGRMAGMPASDILFLAPAEGEDNPRESDARETDSYETRGREVTTEGELKDHPAEGRYVDKNYLPLPAQLLWEAGESNEAETAYLAVAKRMPIRMGLVMDQREINRLLIACGNSPLTVEVRQVRINPSSSAGTTDQGRETSRSSSESGTSLSSEGISSYDVPIEIYGIIYVFNPVDNPKLRPEESDSEAEAQENASPAQPSADEDSAR